jgi:alpha-beta hydrolase superfamily lysophospholipase
MKRWCTAACLLALSACSRPTTPAAAPPAPSPKAKPAAAAKAKDATPTPPDAATVAAATAPEGKIQTGDGATVAAFFRPAVGEAKMGVLLVHMLGRTHADWDAEAAALNKAGYATLAIDLRGHGASRAPDGASHTKFTEAQWKAASGDLAVAMDDLSFRVRDKKFAIVGASIGANLALEYAALAPQAVAGVALLSPGLDYHGVKSEPPLAKLSSLSLLLAAGQGDKYSADSVARLAKLHPAAKATVLTFATDAHGTDLFAKTDLRRKLLAWLGKLG